MSLFQRRHPAAPPGSTCSACLQPCTETDGGTVVMHAECVAWVKDVVDRESRPYRASEYRGGEHRAH